MKKIIELGQKSKAGLVYFCFHVYLTLEGCPSYNKAYVQVLFECKGDQIFDVWANPTGGPERLSTIAQLFDEHVADRSIVRVDTAHAYKSYCLDRPEVNLFKHIATF